MSESLFDTPLPMMLAVLMFSALSWPRIAFRFWAKCGRLVAVIVFVAQIGSLVCGMYLKVRHGSERVEEQRNKESASQASQAIGAEAAPQHER
jgi:hypothetical protein